MRRRRRARRRFARARLPQRVARRGRGRGRGSETDSACGRSAREGGVLCARFRCVCRPCPGRRGARSRRSSRRDDPRCGCRARSRRRRAWHLVGMALRPHPGEKERGRRVGSAERVDHLPVDLLGCSAVANQVAHLGRHVRVEGERDEPVGGRAVLDGVRAREDRDSVLRPSPVMPVARDRHRPRDLGRCVMPATAAGENEHNQQATSHDRRSLWPIASPGRRSRARGL